MAQTPDYSPPLNGSKNKAADVSPAPPVLTQILHRPISTIFTSRLAMLLIALWATITSIQDHTGMFYDALTVGCVLDQYIPLPVMVSRLCNHVHETDSRISDLSDRVGRVEGVVAALRAAHPVTPLSPLRNFALRGGGAVIDASTTSPTYQLPAHTLKSQFLQWFRGRDLQDVHINLPIVILEDIVEVGECWEFKGEYGTVGIHLSERIHLSGFSLNYILPSKVSNMSMARAPRKVTLWGGIDSVEMAKASFQPGIRVFGHQSFVPLVHGEYDIMGESLLQDFSNVEKSSYEIPYRTVMLEIKSNWGANTTCLYYIGVHGVNPEDQ